MPTPILVVGHKNPDNDSICAAVGYAHLKNEMAKRAGQKRSSTFPRASALCLPRANGSSLQALLSRLG